MQSTVTVPWSPAGIDYRPPWEIKFFVLYLLVIAAISILASLNLIRHLWLLRRASFSESGQANNESGFHFDWEMASARIQSLKRIAIFTLLVSLTFATHQAAKLYPEISMEHSGPAALNGGIAEILSPVAVGVLLCSLLYVIIGLSESLLARRMARWKLTQSARK